MRFTIRGTITTGLATTLLTSGALLGQTAATKTGHSTNIHPLGHVELGEFMSIGGIAIEQELSRPYVYVDRWHNEDGFDVINIADPSAPKIIARWRIEHPELHKLSRGETGKYFKSHGRYYYVKATEFETGTLDADVGAIVLDVTDPTKPKEVGRIHSPDFLDGFVNVMPYHYADGRTILFAAVRNWPKGMPPHANVYDMDRFLAGESGQGLIGTVPMPNADPASNFGYHDIHVEFDSTSRQVRLYGAGNGGFYIFDVTRPEAPAFLTGIPTINGVPTERAHTMIPTPDGRYVVTQMEVQFSPLMFFDLKPVWDKTEPSASVPISAWTADWQDLPHNHKMRWPYIFDAAYEDGLQVIDIRDPLKPKTAGYAYTCGCKHMTGYVDEQHIHGPSVFSGAMETDVRNADGLIVLSDLNTGFWAFRMDGFKGYKGSEQHPPNT
jgi:hypothetical protein